jgi:hypothetical protein
MSKVLRKSVERFGRSGFGFELVDPWVLFIPTDSGHTGLTGCRMDLPGPTTSGTPLGRFPV